MVHSTYMPLPSLVISPHTVGLHLKDEKQWVQCASNINSIFSLLCTFFTSQENMTLQFVLLVCFRCTHPQQCEEETSSLLVPTTAILPPRWGWHLLLIYATNQVANAILQTFCAGHCCLQCLLANIWPVTTSWKVWMCCGWPFLSSLVCQLLPLALQYGDPSVLGQIRLCFCL